MRITELPPPLPSPPLFHNNTQQPLNTYNPSLSRPSDDSPESHQNEGFLKNLWHNITQHPAHQQKPDETPSSSSGKDDSTGTSPKKDDDPSKKDSGSP